jgi:hypothetical protein
MRSGWFNRLENLPIPGERPLNRLDLLRAWLLSNATYVKLRVNRRGPPRKAKYSSTTDSEQVPRGKGEKNRYKRSEIDPEIMCLQGVKALWGDGVPFA